MKINKKKIACLALASALVIPGVMGLTGCNKGHTHAFNSDPFYEVVTEGETKIARSWRECSCGAEDAHKKVNNAVIVSANEADDNYAQKVLDTDINGKTIVFDDGTYNSSLEIRPTKNTLDSAYVANASDLSDFSTPIEYSNLTSTPGSVYHYVRELNNVSFVATEKATFKGVFAIIGGIHNNYIYRRPSRLGISDNDIQYDAVREINCYDAEKKYVSAGFTNEDIAYFSHFKLTNINFSRMNFEGSKGRIHLYETFGLYEWKNISITNCSFITDTPWMHTYNDDLDNDKESVFVLGAVVINKDRAYAQNKTYTVENVEFRNNKIEKHYQGLYCSSAKNLDIINNNIESTIHNALGVQSSQNGYFSGNINIINNTIKNTIGENTATKERAIRFGTGNDATIVIKNNIFENCFEDRTGKSPSQGKQLLASDTLTNCTYEFVGNTYDGEAFEDITGSESKFIVYIEEPIIEE